MRLIEAYRTARPGASFGELRAAILGDAAFGAGSRALADAHAAHPQSRTYSYEFAWRSQAVGGDLGAAHTMELPFVFDRTHLSPLHRPYGLLGPKRPPADFASRVHGAWVRFARTGDPGWEAYTSERRTTMRIDDTWNQIGDPRCQERQAWN